MDYEKLAAAYGIMKMYLETLPESRERSISLTKLEESMMWGVNAIQKHGVEEEK